MCLHVRARTLSLPNTHRVTNTDTHRHMQICPYSFILPHTHTSICTYRHTHTRVVLHNQTQNKDTHANIPLLCSAGGFLTGLRCQPIKSSHYDSLFKRALLASISRHSNRFNVIHSKWVLVHFGVNGVAPEHTSVVLSL